MNHWRTAYETHGPAVLAFLASRTRQRSDAEDLLQETFVRAIRADGALKEASKLRPYLMTTAHNLLINQYRKRRPVLFSEAESATAAAESAESREDDPESATSFEHLSSRLAKILAAMRPNHARAFRLAVLEERPYKEVAKLTGWTLAQVKINVYRARKHAIAELGEELP